MKSFADIKLFTDRNLVRYSSTSQRNFYLTRLVYPVRSMLQQIFNSNTNYTVFYLNAIGNTGRAFAGWNFKSFFATGIRCRVSSTDVLRFVFAFPSQLPPFVEKLYSCLHRTFRFSFQMSPMQNAGFAIQTKYHRFKVVFLNADSFLNREEDFVAQRKVLSVANNRTWCKLLNRAAKSSQVLLRKELFLKDVRLKFSVLQKRDFYG